MSGIDVVGGGCRRVLGRINRGVTMSIKDPAFIRPGLTDIRRLAVRLGLALELLITVSAFSYRAVVLPRHRARP